MHIITRAEAKAAGQTTYFTGKPCSNGHFAARSVANWGCAQCAAAISKKLYRKKSKTEAFVAANRARVRQWAEKNQERTKASGKAWRDANKKRTAERAKAYRVANRETLQARQAERRNGNPKYLAKYKALRERPGDKERVAKNGRAWRNANKEHVRLAKRRYQMANQEHVQKRGKKWRETNPEKAKAIKAASAHKRRQRIDQSDDQPTTAQVMAIYARKMCAVCARTDGPMELDHIKALSRGGAHHISNLQLLCRPCNRRKWSKDHSAWLAEQAGA